MVTHVLETMGWGFYDFSTTTVTRHCGTTTTGYVTGVRFATRTVKVSPFVIGKTHLTPRQVLTIVAMLVAINSAAERTARSFEQPIVGKSCITHCPATRKVGVMGEADTQITVTGM